MTQEKRETTQPRCGFVAIVGCPNAGKSTLLNSLTGAKVSIVSSKVQTTRRRILGIALQDQTQIIFMDTPGIFEPKKPLEKAMVKVAWSTLSEADQTVIIVDISLSDLETSRDLVHQVQKAGTSSFILVLNKIDQVPMDQRLGKIAQMTEGIEAEMVFIISALSGNGVPDLMTYLAEKMPLGPWHYAEDQLTDLPERELAAEVTRENLFHRLYDEIPYGLTVETEKWEHFKDGSIKINQVVIVNRDSHKGIVLGKGGRQIKAVGAASRQELETFFGCKVHLILHVRVDTDWMKKRDHFQAMGLGAAFDPKKN